MDVAIQLTQDKKEKLIVVLSFTLIFSSMNATMFNVALPAISTEFSLHASQASWIITSYMIVYAIGAVIYGRLADQFKLKDLLTIGLVFFAVGSIIGFFSANYWSIVIGRALQAMGAAVLPASSMIIPTRYFNAETRGRALGMTSAGLAFGVAIGPIVAGFLTTWLHWKYLFAISLFTIAAIPFYRKYLDDVAGTSSKIDFLGAFLLALTIAVLLFAISTASLIYLLAGITCLALFVIRIKSVKNPFIQPALFRNSDYSMALFIYALGAGIGFALPYLTPLVLIELNHLTAFQTGLYMFPGALSAALLAKTGGKIADSRGNSGLTFLAISCFFICFCSLALMAGAPAYFITCFLIFGYVGQTFFQLAMANTISQTLPRNQTGVGMGLFMLVNFVASSTATAIMGTAISKNNATVYFKSLFFQFESVKYSNIYSVLAIMAVVIALIYSIALRKKLKEAKSCIST
ncbi:MFS transporter [Pelosinus propionicus]|uniref:MFS transporter, DHA2 family, metal-tetracycline-proton antiporter n=1 Tax=Pelosinus propionicus DSM 13327 TaxID=1123291 RepID=A0A1I4MDF8_9FIRM|nr:MFS transporter [Pelosinus propionicus]SFM01219.1 MFS transporter, DHA2 family, metal-tetracycline-proton antiporter [Pelosinus propionicus DSM 13327]